MMCVTSLAFWLRNCTKLVIADKHTEHDELPLKLIWLIQSSSQFDAYKALVDLYALFEITAECNCALEIAII